MNKSVKIVHVGDYSVGKSRLTDTFVTNKTDFHCYNSRFGRVSVKKSIKVDNTVLDIDIWDSEGLERFDAQSITYYRGADGVMLVYDVTNRESFDNLKDKWYPEVCTYSEKYTQCILVGNKCDMECKRAVESCIAKEFADSLNIPFIETSAKENINVEFAFMTLAAIVVRKLSETVPKENILPEERKRIYYSSCYC